MPADDADGLSHATDPQPVLGIEFGAGYLPPLKLPLSAWARQLGATADRLLPAMLDNGLAHYRSAPDMDNEALAMAAVGRLLDLSGLAPREVDLVLFGHANYSSVMAAPSSLPAQVARRFGMTRARCHSIAQQGCASVLCALRLLRTLMWRHPTLRNAVVVSADKVFGERYRHIGPHAIQSDGAVALWVRRGCVRNRLGHSSFRADARHYRGAQKGAVLTARFGVTYPILARRVLAELMQHEHWTGADVDAVLAMNDVPTILHGVMDTLGLARDKLHLDSLGDRGHMFAADPFLNFLDHFSDRSRVRTGNAILFAPANMGVFCALGIHDSWTGPGEFSARPTR